MDLDFKEALESANGLAKFMQAFETDFIALLDKYVDALNSNASEYDSKMPKLVYAEFMGKLMAMVYLLKAKAQGIEALVQKHHTDDPAIEEFIRRTNIAVLKTVDAKMKQFDK